MQHIVVLFIATGPVREKQEIQIFIVMKKRKTYVLVGGIISLSTILVWYASSVDIHRKSGIYLYEHVCQDGKTTIFAIAIDEHGEKAGTYFGMLDVESEKFFIFQHWDKVSGSASMSLPEIDRTTFSAGRLKINVSLNNLEGASSTKTVAFVKPLSLWRSMRMQRYFYSAINKYKKALP